MARLLATETPPLPGRWQNFQQALSGLGSYAKGQMSQRQALEDAFMKALMEAKIKEAISPGKWEPRSMEEALGLERAKAAVKAKSQRPFKLSTRELETIGGMQEEKIAERGEGIKPSLAEKTLPYSFGLLFSPFIKNMFRKAKEQGKEKQFQKLMSPFYRRFEQQFLGEDEQDIDTLVEEYQTTDDPVRLEELEQILRAQGVEFE